MPEPDKSIVVAEIEQYWTIGPEIQGFLSDWRSFYRTCPSVQRYFVFTAYVSTYNCKKNIPCFFSLSQILSFWYLFQHLDVNQILYTLSCSCNKLIGAILKSECYVFFFHVMLRIDNCFKGGMFFSLWSWTTKCFSKETEISLFCF